MTIKNLKTEFSTDQFSDTEILSIVLADEVTEGIKKRRELFVQNEWLAESATIEYTPTGIQVVDSEIHGDVITVSIGVDAMLFVVTDDNGETYETESVPYIALDKERFLLQDGGDNIYQWQVGLDDGVFDPDDFTAIYADSIEEAISQFKEICPDATDQERDDDSDPDTACERDRERHGTDGYENEEDESDELRSVTCKFSPDIQ